ncbi:MAG: acetyl-CoA C-acyltransferase [Actinomycetota bacterium]|nr:acetyl-CoA C-acyltransferase [Actinomycetota bacterium]
MNEVLIIDAVRTAVGRRNGTLARTGANDLLGTAQKAIIERSGIDPLHVDQVVGGCIQQIGEQSANVARNAWLTAGLPLQVPAATVNVQCGSSQQATMIAQGFIGSGMAGVAVTCGVETMSIIPMGSALANPAFGAPRGGSYAEVYEPATQFEGADRIAHKYGITRRDTDAFGVQSQQRAIAAWAEDRYAGQIAPVTVNVFDDAGAVTGTKVFERDECMRESSLEGLAKLRTNREADDAVHTAGTSSQISDGAGALLLASPERASQLGLKARGRIVDSVLVGCDPVLMLEGPIPATEALLRRTGLSITDIDVFEVNEAFASVVLAWQKTVGADPAKVNPNGGAIALGHPLGGTGVILITKALNELERTGGRYGLISMCCGGGLGTGTIIERLPG